MTAAQIQAVSSEASVDGLIVDLTGDGAVLDLRRSASELDASPPPVAQRLAVRTFDVVVASLALIVLSPVLLVLALVIRLNSPGPAIYRSPRMGRGGSTYGALKFRSMVADADAVLEELLKTDPQLRAEYLSGFKLKDDPRVTKLGRLLRRTNLDELPQLWNVLRGQMSIVGPRPKLLDEPARYGTAMDTVLRVRPGLTGQWQVSGRNDISFDERILIDVDYALNRTMLGDVVICFKTALLMLRPSRNGAY